jgi:hypothetical protein
MRKSHILFSAVLLCLSVMTAGGATSDEITAPSCMEAAALDQSNPVSDEAVSDEATIVDRDGELLCTSPATDLALSGVMPIDDLGDRAAICRLIPECSANADCDAQCGGPGLGRCGHSRCPIRVCRCR